MSIPKSNTQSPESLILRFMREKRKLTLLFVGHKLKIKPKIIDHIEQGRRVPTEQEVTLFLELYDYSFEVFNEMKKIKPLTKQAANHYFLART